jgi:hypothetical protein
MHHAIRRISIINSNRLFLYMLVSELGSVNRVKTDFGLMGEYHKAGAGVGVCEKGG